MSRRALLSACAAVALVACLGASASAGAPARTANVPTFAEVSYPPKLRIRPQHFAVINRPGESPGAGVTVTSASWTDWGRRVASASGRGRMCGNMGAGCKSVAVRIKARKRVTLDGCRMYTLLVVTLPKFPGIRLHDDAERRSSC